MRIIVVDTPEQMGKVAAEIVLAERAKKAKGDFVLGLATGSTPIPLYKELIRLKEEGKFSPKKLMSFNLDEYVGLPPSHDQSYRYFMNQQLFDELGIDKKKTFVPDGMAKDIEAFCADYEAKMKAAGGVDVQVLGIGRNGHVGFNEPGTSLASRTHKVKLTADTIDANARFFAKASDVPTEAITMGVGTILESKVALLLASGANKADVILKAIEGPVTAAVPASALQLHPKPIFVLTRDACCKGLSFHYEKKCCSCC
ncbi:MAG TPA: glucosamine-6-phosphate deaminase [Candidatus Brocadiia bacterium]|nr:glucosamine-6-phosphate deaminase [Candidatus Brocadiia bacterium]